MLVLTTKEMKRAEELAIQKGLSYQKLMENSGQSIYDWIDSHYHLEGKRIFILAGSGNNSGDGFVLARLLAESKCENKITVVMCDGVVSSPVAKDMCNKIVTKNNIEIVNLVQSFDDLVSRISELGENDIIVDAIYGTGLTTELPPLVFSIFSIVNKSKATRIAIDVPSGISSNDGRISPNTFRANITLAIACYKPAHVIDACSIYCRRIEILDIGISRTTLENACVSAATDFGKLITVEFVQSILQPRNERAHKGMFGRLLNVAGSHSVVGPAMISTLSALRIGAGYTNLATTMEVAQMVAPHLMEAVTTPLPENQIGTVSSTACDTISRLLSRSTACLVGCGLGKSDDCSVVIEYIIKNADCNIIVDSDALNAISNNVDILKSAKHQIMITPHIGQMAKLVKRPLTDTINNFAEISLEFATKYNTIVVIKSDNTHIVTPEEKIYRNETGNVGLAKTGSGDMLAGIIAGLVTQGLTLENAAICGTYINGATADWLKETHSTYSMLTRDLIEIIPTVMKDLGL